VLPSHTACPRCPKQRAALRAARRAAAQDVTLFIDDIGPPAAHGTKASYAPIGSSAAAGALVPMTQAPVSNSAPAFNGGNNGLIYSGSSFYGCGRRPSRRVHVSAFALTGTETAWPTKGAAAGRADACMPAPVPTLAAHPCAPPWGLHTRGSRYLVELRTDFV